jgi:hypothetical protein
MYTALVAKAKTMRAKRNNKLIESIIRSYIQPSIETAIDCKRFSIKENLFTNLELSRLTENEFDNVCEGIAEDIKDLGYEVEIELGIMYISWENAQLGKTLPILVKH